MVTGTAQRAAWNEKRVPPLEAVRDGIWSIPVPIPGSPLRYTTVYALASDAGVSLIDAGIVGDEAWAALCDGLAAFGAHIADVRAVLVTHQHIDHVGLARRIQEESGAWVALHPADARALARPAFRDEGIAVEVERAWLTRMGASLDEAIAARPTFDVDRAAVALVPDRLVEHGDRIELPGWSLQAVHTPGHTPGHLCFYEGHGNLLFAGDTVLPRITPNISTAPEETGDPLGDFLSSLDHLAAYDPDEVLPAHEWRFRGLPHRLAELATHHEHRLAELLDVIRQHPARRPWQLAEWMTWSRPWDQYDGFMRVTAVAETAAHATHLAARGLVIASREDSPRYTAVT